MSNINKPEILAPCGELLSVYGAINAGADAIYLGAELFSARAYAKNLENSDVVRAINYAHLFGVKVYLTLNILLKNREVEDALEMLNVFYEAGLDAVIVQDLGLLSLVNEHFPDLDIHASTQMSIMSKSAIEFLKGYNVTRVVPARELTINEIKELKSAGLEIECFVHGAMCYGYSGKCLLSSLAGGRSGNRGRCAGPCRKSYTVDGARDECYPISMKDMCSITAIDKLIEAGVDSFKIEGRMKDPEYSAGVSAIYRKYVDMYLETGQLKVSNKDLDFLSRLYIRSEIEEGYFNKIHGSNMITMSKPSYNGKDKEIVDKIKEKYLTNRKKLAVNLTVYSYVGSPLKVTCSLLGASETFEGPQVLEAINKALDEEAYIKQFSKLGDTDFEIGRIKVITDANGFLPVSAINEFRRGIFASLADKLMSKRQPASPMSLTKCVSANRATNHCFCAGVKTKEQLAKVLSRDFIEAIIVDLMLINSQDIELYKNCSKGIFIRMPEIMRQRTSLLVEKRLRYVLDNLDIEGIYVGGLDSLSMCRKVCPDITLIGDFGLYVFNTWAEDFALSYLSGYTSTFENNDKELKHFNHKDKRQMVCYGYIPVMYSANCLHNTLKKSCDKANAGRGDSHILYDEAGRGFKAVPNHELCYNTIYNCLPFDALMRIEDYIDKGENAVYRLEFSIEDKEQTDLVLDRYERFFVKGAALVADGYEYTNGHLKRGVE